MRNNEKLRIAVVYNKFGRSGSGGARKSLLTLLDGLTSNWTLDIDVYQPPPVDEHPDSKYQYTINTHGSRQLNSLVWANQVLVRLQWRRYLRDVLTTDKYHLILTQTMLAPAAVAVGSERSIPTLYFVRSLALATEKYNPESNHLKNLLSTDFGGRIQYPFVVKNFNQYRTSARDATVTIANSTHTARRLQRLFDADSEVIYPPIEPDRFRVSYDPEGFITMVNPRSEYKGPDIFLDLAEKRSQESFLLAGPLPSDEYRRRAATLPNVTHWEWCDDMREVYGKSKIVVVPSRWEEPFGRVPAEAMVSGIPVVVSNRGGLPEVVGDTAPIVDEVESVGAWSDTLDRALATHDPSAQRERAKRFTASRQIDKLITVLEDLPFCSVDS